jgi:transcriptional antiterminator
MANCCTEKTISKLDDGKWQEEVEAVQNEHVEDLTDGARLQRLMVPIRKKINETEATEPRLLNEMTKHLAQMESKNGTRKEENAYKRCLLSLVKEIKKIPEENKLVAKSEVFKPLRQKTPQQAYQHFIQNPGMLRHYTPLPAPSPESELSYETGHSNVSSLQDFYWRRNFPQCNVYI